MTASEQTPRSPDKSASKPASGFRRAFMAAALPGAAVAGALLLGARPDIVLLAGATGALGGAATGAIGSKTAFMAASGAMAALGIIASQGIIIAGAGMAALCALAEDNTPKHSPKKILAGTLAGAFLSAAMSYGALSFASNDGEAPAPDTNETGTSQSTNFIPPNRINLDGLR